MWGRVAVSSVLVMASSLADKHENGVNLLI